MDLKCNNCGKIVKISGRSSHSKGLSCSDLDYMKKLFLENFRCVDCIKNGK